MSIALCRKKYNRVLDYDFSLYTFNIVLSTSTVLSTSAIRNETLRRLCVMYNYKITFRFWRQIYTNSNALTNTHARSGQVLFFK